MIAQVTDLRVYPVKSMAGVDLDRAVVEPWGLRADRRWMVVSSSGEVVTARERHALLSVRATPDDEGGVTLAADGRASLHVVPPTAGADVRTELSRLSRATAAGDEADRWLSDVLGEAVHLVWLDDPRRRPVSPAHGGREGDPLTLADAGPLLMTSEASRQQLDAWIAEEAALRDERAPGPLDMRRFRPNVVVAGDIQPFAEDQWRVLRIGDVTFRWTEHCDRCVMTTLDPDTTAGGKEPIRTLARHRAWGGSTWFGIRLLPVAGQRSGIDGGVGGESVGLVTVGDDVEVLERAAQ